MRSWKLIGIVLFICALTVAAVAERNNLGVRDVRHITFYNPMRVAGAMLPAGEYVVRHTMEGMDHVMVFESAKNKSLSVKAHCKLVPLGAKSERTATVYEVNAANERVLQELVFQGDTSKHVLE